MYLSKIAQCAQMKHKKESIYQKLYYEHHQNERIFHTNYTTFVLLFLLLLIHLLIFYVPGILRDKTMENKKLLNLKIKIRGGEVLTHLRKR